MTFSGGADSSSWRACNRTCTDYIILSVRTHGPATLFNLLIADGQGEAQGRLWFSEGCIPASLGLVFDVPVESVRACANEVGLLV